jgi:hypothetical protein
LNKVLEEISPKDDSDETDQSSDESGHSTDSDTSVDQETSEKEYPQDVFVKD